MTNQQYIYNSLEQMRTLEKQIEESGFTSVKPLAQKLAKLTRQTLARIAQEAFKNE